MKRLIGAAAVALALTVVTADAQRGPGTTRWVPLGSQTVGFLIDRDVIRIGRDEAWFRDEGAFRALRFTAERNDIHMNSVRVVYLNGFSETFNIGQLIREGQSFILDLRGERSYLREIEMVYRSRPDFRGQAVMRVDGEAVRPAPPPPPPPAPVAGLVPLGTATVGFGVERDVIRVNQAEDWFRRQPGFRSLRFEVERNDIHLMAIRLVYLNGFAEDFRIDQGVRVGQAYVLDLRGERSFIRDIEMTYRARPGFAGQAVVRVLGEPIRRGPRWDLLTSGQFDRRNARVELPVSRAAERVGQIRLKVTGGSITVREVIINFPRGNPLVVRVDARMADGDTTRAIDLPGDRSRRIQSVVLNLEPRNRPGTVSVQIEALEQPGS